MVLLETIKPVQQAYSPKGLQLISPHIPFIGFFGAFFFSCFMQQGMVQCSTGALLTWVTAKVGCMVRNTKRVNNIEATVFIKANVDHIRALINDLNSF